MMPIAGVTNGLLAARTNQGSPRKRKQDEKDLRQAHEYCHRDEDRTDLASIHPRAVYHSHKIFGYCDRCRRNRK